VTRNDGVLDAWDLFYRQNSPAYSHKVSNVPLSTVGVQPAGGRHIAVGDVTGTVSLLEMSENLSVPPHSEKMAMGLSFERESKREENLEKRALALARARKAVTGGGGGEPPTSPTSTSPTKTEPLPTNESTGGSQHSAVGFDASSNGTDEAIEKLEREFSSLTGSGVESVESSKESASEDTKAGDS